MVEDLYNQNKKQIKKIIESVLDGRMKFEKAADEIRKIDKIQEVHYRKRQEFAIHAGSNSYNLKDYSVGKSILKRDKEKDMTELDKLAMTLKLFSEANNPRAHSSVEISSQISTKHHTEGYRKAEEIAGIQGIYSKLVTMSA